ncbi:IMP dehydrogenase [bacterium]|nr:IMP dehydrogenase [bacterium]
MIQDSVKLDYSDVLIVPRFSDIDSRKKVDIDYNPIIASNMDGVGTFEMAKELAKYGATTCLVKHYTLDDWCKFSKTVNETTLKHIFVSTGILKEDIELTERIVNMLFDDHGVDTNICIDVANGYMNQFYDAVSYLKKKNPRSKIMAGSVVTGKAVRRLEDAGADLVKVGIGSGAVCTTRIKTGIGYPQFSAVMECALESKYGGIADGGITCVGDIAKAIGAGAKYVKLGSMLAGHDEGGATNTEDGVVFYGMSSRTAQEKHKGYLANYRSSEGRTIKIPYKGPVQNTMQDILGGLRSTCAYVGAYKVSQLHLYTEFIRVNNQYNRSMEPYTVAL